MEIRPDEFLSFTAWLGGALLFFLWAVPVAIVVAVFVAFLISAVRFGPGEAFFRIARVVNIAVTQDFPNMSMRRIVALARLAFQEAVRRRVLIGFAVFAIVLLFAGWFLDTKNDNPAKIYISFVLNTTQYLVLLLALFLSAFSLPTDIKNRTIYTVVTKPVRASEIVLGRILGFVALGSLLLVVMGVISYIFVIRGVDHEHRIVDALEPVPADQATDSLQLVGRTTADAYHRHRVEVGKDGQGRTDTQMGHWHEVTRDGDNYLVGQPQGALQARVPHYGVLRFLDREGKEGEGVSVGKEWEYRSYIEGRSLATAIWRFDDVTADRYPDGLPLALNLSVFRTHKGDIETTVRGVIIINNPDPAKSTQSEPISFKSSEYTEQIILIPRKLKRFGTDRSTADIDVVEDLTSDGLVEVWIRCDDRGQYFGMAQADVYLRSSDASFTLNFFKGYLGIWMQMTVVVCFGVMYSTFLSSPVAMLATVATFVIGLFKGFISGIWSGDLVGGGPIEATIRTFRQENLVSELDFGFILTSVMKWSDFFLLSMLKAFSTILPSFDRLGRFPEYVAYNYNIYGDLLNRHLLTTLVYVLAISVVGYFCLKTREIAA